MKKLIINADDFGYSKIFNESILELIENKLIKSTTVMVNYISKDQEYQINKLIKLKEKLNISVGLHLDFENNTNYEEIITQYNKFIYIFNFKPSHLDIHKPKKNYEEKFNLIKFCNKYKLPCRNLEFQEEEKEKVKTTYSKYINGTNLEINQIKTILDNLKDNKIYEILFHPGTFDINCKSSLNKDREKDIEKIKYINSILEDWNIDIVSFKDI